MKQTQAKFVLAMLGTAIGLSGVNAQTPNAPVPTVAGSFDSNLLFSEWDHESAEHLLRLSDAANRRAEIEAAAEAGDGDALALAGMAWDVGLWGDQDAQKAWDLILTAATKGHSRSMAIVGIQMWDGQLVPQNRTEAEGWLLKAADAGSGLAQAMLARLMIEKQLPASNDAELLKLLHGASDRGIAWAATYLGDTYIADGSPNYDPAKAKEQFLRAARLGDLAALTSAGAVAWYGKSEPYHAQQIGFAQLELAARNGQLEAVKIVSNHYLASFPNVDPRKLVDATELLEGAWKNGAKNDKDIIDLRNLARNAAARSGKPANLRQHNIISYKQASGGYKTITMTDQQIVDSINFVLPPWPQDIPWPELPAIKGDRSPPDEYGVSEREWREQDAWNFVPFVMIPDILKKVREGFLARDAKAMTLVALVASGTRGGVNWSAYYPQCANSQTAPAFCASLEQRLDDYTTATGIADDSSSSNGLRIADSYATAIAGVLVGQPSMRAQVQRALSGGLYNDEDRSRMLVLADFGYLGAVLKLEDESGECSGNSEVRAFLARHGRRQIDLVNAAMLLGDPNPGFDYAKQLRDASCVGRDPEGAARLFRAAADLGHIDAKYALMQMYAGYSYSNFSKNYREALRLANEIEAAQGSPVNPNLMAELRAGAEQETRQRAAIGEVTDDPNKAPNAATIRAVVMRELRVVMNRFSGMSLLGMFGNPPFESWNYDDGSFLFETQNPNDMFRVYYRTDFSISGASCKPAPGVARAYDCTYGMSATLDYRVGRTTLYNGSSGQTARQSHRFVFVDGQWRSESVRAAVMANMSTNGIGAAGAGGGGNSLCRSLYAGVVAAGGKSTSKGLDPTTWGC